MTGLVIVRGAGDLATGTIVRLANCGLHVAVTECARPSAIRRRAALSEAVYDGTAEVEGVVCRRMDSEADLTDAWQAGQVPLFVDEAGDSIRALRPAVVVDAILAKRNLGTRRDMAPITVALGPGFAAGRDVDAVIETMRGHNLGRIFYRGAAQPNTGVPGNIGGYTSERVIHAPADGALTCVQDAAGQEVGIGSVVRRARSSPTWAERRSMPRLRAYCAASSGRATRSQKALKSPTSTRALRSGTTAAPSRTRRDASRAACSRPSCIWQGNGRSCYFDLLDAAATSFLKPPAVKAAVLQAFDTLGSPGRGGHPLSLRGRACGLSLPRTARGAVRPGRPRPRVLAYNATDALSTAIFGLFRPRTMSSRPPWNITRSCGRSTRLRTRAWG